MIDNTTQVIISIDGINGQLLQTTLAAYKDYYCWLGWKLEGWAMPMKGLETKPQRPLEYQPVLMRRAK